MRLRIEAQGREEASPCELPNRTQPHCGEHRCRLFSFHRTHYRFSTPTVPSTCAHTYPWAILVHRCGTSAAMVVVTAYKRQLLLKRSKG